MMIIAIDGLAVNGKTTLAKMISKKLNFKNFNTGAIYRCMALEIINKNLDINHIETVIEHLKNIDINFEGTKVILNGKDVSEEIRTEKISLCSNKWATNEQIKEIVRKKQKEFISKYDTVIEGRDIGTRIAPNADIKFYLYSDFETRVNRAWNQDRTAPIDKIRENIRKIDDVDIYGGNFIKPQNAIEIKTDDKTIEQVYDIMMDKIMSYMESNEKE